MIRTEKMMQKLPLKTKRIRLNRIPRTRRSLMTRRASRSRRRPRLIRLAKTPPILKIRLNLPRSRHPR